MTKQASPPPTRDSGSQTAPPSPPAWRHWLLLLAAVLFVLLFFLLPATRVQSSVTLTYTQFLHDVSANRVKTVTLGQGGAASGKLTSGTSYTTVIPSEAGSPLLTELTSHGVGITAVASGTSFASDVLSWIILLLPLIVLGYFWWRLSKDASGQFQGAFGVGRSKAQVFDVNIGRKGQHPSVETDGTWSVGSYSSAAASATAA